MSAVKSLAEKASEDRKPVSADNPFLAFQEQVSKQIVHALDSWRNSQEALSEAIFLAVYGSPAVQAAVGIDPQSVPSRRREMSARHREMLQARIAELKSRIERGRPSGSGGSRPALCRVGAGDGGRAQPRGTASGSVATTVDARLTLPEFKMLVREQFFMLLLDREGALAAIPKAVAREFQIERRAAFAAIREVLSASAEISGEAASRLQQIAGPVRRRCRGRTGEERERRPFRSQGEGIVTPVGRKQ